MSKKCKKTSHSKNRDLAMRNTYAHKLAKLKKQVKKNPSDYIAHYNLVLLLRGGVGTKGYSG